MTRPRVAGKDRTTKSKSALQRALDELTLLPREEMMIRYGLVATPLCTRLDC